jgi:hypothetical protein
MRDSAKKQSPKTIETGGKPAPLELRHEDD